MINWTIKIARPILTEGMFFQVRYRKVDSQDWIPFSPNPTTNEFTITALEDDTNYEAEICTVCLNGELSRPVYHQLKEGKKDDEPTQPQPPTTPDIKISWYDEERDYLTGDTTDMEGTDTEVSVGASENVIFEYKNPNRDWVVKSNRPHYLDAIPLEVGLNEIRAYKFINNSTKIYSNVLKYNKIQNNIQTRKYRITGTGSFVYSVISNGSEKKINVEKSPFRTGHDMTICAVKGSIVGNVNVTELGNCDENTPIKAECKEYIIRVRPRETVSFTYRDCQGVERQGNFIGDPDDRVEKEEIISALEGSIRGNISYELYTP